MANPELDALLNALLDQHMKMVPGPRLKVGMSRSGPDYSLLGSYRPSTRGIELYHTGRPADEVADTMRHELYHDAFTQADDGRRSLGYRDPSDEFDRPLANQFIDYMRTLGLPSVPAQGQFSSEEALATLVPAFEAMLEGRTAARGVEELKKLMGFDRQRTLAWVFGGRHPTVDIPQHSDYVPPEAQSIWQRLFGPSRVPSRLDSPRGHRSQRPLPGAEGG